MGNSFESKEHRSSAFDNAIGNLLPGVKYRTKLVGRKVDTQPDRVIHKDGYCILIREDQVEIGTGDPYTKVSRSFDLACENMQRNPILPDAPVFLMC